MANPQYVVTGEIVYRRPARHNGEWLRLDFWIPVLDEEDKPEYWKWWCQVDWNDVRNGAVEYVLSCAKLRFFDFLTPISYQRLQEQLRAQIKDLDFPALMPPEIPNPTNTSWRLQ